MPTCVRLTHRPVFSAGMPFLKLVMEPSPKTLHGGAMPFLVELLPEALRGEQRLLDLHEVLPQCPPLLISERFTSNLQHDDTFLLNGRVSSAGPCLALHITRCCIPHHASCCT